MRLKLQGQRKVHSVPSFFYISQLVSFVLFERVKIIEFKNQFYERGNSKKSNFFFHKTCYIVLSKTVLKIKVFYHSHYRPFSVNRNIQSYLSVVDQNKGEKGIKQKENYMKI